MNLLEVQGSMQMLQVLIIGNAASSFKDPLQRQQPRDSPRCFDLGPLDANERPSWPWQLGRNRLIDDRR